MEFDDYIDNFEYLIGFYESHSEKQFDIITKTAFSLRGLSDDRWTEFHQEICCNARCEDFKELISNFNVYAADRGVRPRQDESRYD